MYHNGGTDGLIARLAFSAVFVSLHVTLRQLLIETSINQPGITSTGIIIPLDKRPHHWLVTTCFFMIWDHANIFMSFLYLKMIPTSLSNIESFGR